MNTILNFVNKISIIFIVSMSLLVPAFFLTITTDFYDFNKFTLLFIAVVILMTLSLIRLYAKNEITINSSAVSVPAVLFVTATIITVIINAPNKVESLITPQGAGGIIVVTLWFLLISAIVKLKDIAWVVQALMIAATVLGIMAILQIMGLGLNKILPNNPYFESKYWTPAGSLLTLVMFQFAILPLVIIQFERLVKEYTKSEKTNLPLKLVGYAVSLIIIVISVFIILSQLIFTAKPVILPLSAGWTITLESLKNVQRALFGVGPGNYIFAYTTGKPPFMNMSDYWNVRFLSASNWYMQIIVEYGLVGLTAYVMLIAGVVKKILAYVGGLRKNIYRYDPLFLGITISLAMIMLQQLILPGNFVQLFTFYTLLALISVYLTNNTFVEKSRILSMILIVLGGLFLTFSSYVMFRAYAAEYYMKLSVDYSRKNKAKETYDNQVKALQANPYIDRYHVIFSQTNLALASALSQKKELTDREKVDIITLLTQTTNEGKQAVFANPTNVQNWENLARIYKSMVNQVRDADRWALQSYQQAILLDPLNPLLRLEIGGVYYSIGRFDLATQVFQQTINLKPDWANAHYNLALALREQKDYANAAIFMQRAIDLLPKESQQDKERAEKELEEIKKLIPTQPTGQQNPTQPAPSPTLSLPNDSGPEKAINRTQTESDRLGVQPSPSPAQQTEP